MTDVIKFNLRVTVKLFTPNLCLMSKSQSQYSCFRKGIKFFPNYFIITGCRLVIVKFLIYQSLYSYLKAINLSYI